MSEQDIEREIQDKGLNAARITPADLDAEIVGEQFHVFENTTTTVCALSLRNGMVLVGSSACVSPANFDAALGQKIAREKAREQLWQLLGFRLRDRIAFAH